MKTLKDYAIQHGIQYRAAWNRFNAGKIPSAFKDEFGKILIDEEEPDRPVRVTVYARVSSSQNKSNLDSQAERVSRFVNAKGLPVHSVIKECASGLSDKRRKLHAVLSDPCVTHIAVEHKDRLTRFGFRYIEEWMRLKGTQIIVANEALDDQKDLMQDFVSLVTSFCARLYGLRRSKRQTEKLIKGMAP